MTEWQDIATAPKDGSTVMLWVPGSRQPVQIGHWVDRQTVEYGKVTHSRAELSYGALPLMGEAPPPSHWAAMPTAPTAESLTVEHRVARAVRQTLPGFLTQHAYERG